LGQLAGGVKGDLGLFVLALIHQLLGFGHHLLGGQKLVFGTFPGQGAAGIGDGVAGLFELFGRGALGATPQHRGHAQHGEAQ